MFLDVFSPCIKGLPNRFDSTDSTITSSIELLLLFLSVSFAAGLFLRGQEIPQVPLLKVDEENTPDTREHGCGFLIFLAAIARLCQHPAQVGRFQADHHVSNIARRFWVPPGVARLRGWADGKPRKWLSPDVAGVGTILLQSQCTAIKDT